MVEIIILVSPQLKSDRDGIEARRVVNVLQEAVGQELVQNDPQATDEELRRYYTITAGTDAEAQEIVKRALATDGVEAAYVKPRDEPPG